MEERIRVFEKKVEAQRFVMTNLRNGIDYLKDHCHREINNDVIIGCEWSEWTPWSRCTKTCGGGTEQRVREKLPGLGSCADGNSTDNRVCQNDACPLENDGESLVMVIGGETVVSRENEHSTSVEIIGPNGLCKVITARCHYFVSISICGTGSAGLLANF